MPFSDVIGQERALNVLSRSITLNRVAHAYLFTGIEGCGKRKSALSFVQAIFCGKPDACGVCPSCKKVASGQHPDLHILEADGAFIKIDQVRELQKELSYRPFEAPKKACIIDGAEKLNQSSGNALLKTLEEPPGDALMILLTAERAGVLQTILSRCQELAFQPLSVEAVEGRLVRDGFSAEAARIAATLSGGSLKRGIEIATEGVLAGRNEFLERVTSFELSNIAPLFAASEEYAADKDRLPELLELLLSFLRDVLIYRRTPEALANADLAELVAREAARFSERRTMELIEQLLDMRRQLARNVNARLALEVFFMRLAAR
ncbi:DNA polymerase III subunit delta' [Geomesophilobacter sediminis]|uniref:DNA polymerase III subunit delta' n=1 Tax=Geomesophilobacter sediminis TaxID=2798584 RepID=A0A8J7M2U3_9BACT|nr:DNA polymerase III subunit delta' [Geomesophilobacter sediminis]MBJ6727714.1 DNA polymerase III subunit delta' [Geomesophilobacter sediminis]